MKLYSWLALILWSVQVSAQDTESVLPKPVEEKPFWPAPVITESNFDEWMQFVEPTSRELNWRKVRWHHSLSEAAKEAKTLNRPILLWSMNGHPCGET